MSTDHAARLWLALGVLLTNIALNIPMNGPREMLLVAGLGWFVSFCFGKFISAMRKPSE